MIVYEGYQIKPYKEVCTAYIIVTDGKGGKIPDILAGFYTTKTHAKTAIDSYLVGKTKKEVKNAEELPKSRG